MHRLHSHLLAGNALKTPHAVVSHMTAVQAQDYLASLWAIGVRMKSATEEIVERAIAERKIVRCWPMRGTLHFVAAEDLHWMLELLAPRVLARHRKRLENDFELDAKTLRRARTLVERALQGGGSLTRNELYALLEKAKIATANSRGLHILFSLAHERVICFGARRGKQPTFVLLDEWVAPSPSKSREDAMIELARRYAKSHGPATSADFAWWSGLTPKEAREAFEAAKISERESSRRASSSVHLLPAFDEYTVAYRDRSSIVDAAFARRINNGGGLLSPVVVVNGRVVATWKRTLRNDAVELDFAPFAEFDVSTLQREADRYAKFLGKERAMLRG
ncbi:MAG TPA: winged helix DNA-binding domain-containing protein [Thermoanaerobaculia bacterium]